MAGASAPVVLKTKKDICVLVVDSESVTCDLVCQILNDYQVRSALTCAQALASMKQWPADVAVVNYELTDGTGFTLLSQLYALNPKLLAILIGSDLAKAQADPNRKQVKINRMLPEPFTAKVLREAIQKVLEKPSEGQT